MSTKVRCSLNFKVAKAQPRSPSRLSGMPMIVTFWIAKWLWKKSRVAFHSNTVHGEEPVHSLDSEVRLL